MKWKKDLAATSCALFPLRSTHPKAPTAASRSQPNSTRAQLTDARSTRPPAALIVKTAKGDSGRARPLPEPWRRGRGGGRLRSPCVIAGTPKAVAGELRGDGYPVSTADVCGRPRESELPTVERLLQPRKVFLPVLNRHNGRVSLPLPRTHEGRDFYGDLLQPFSALRSAPLGHVICRVRSR
jgi:hypothetical protein